jgi:signal transduction histidine kinase
MGMSRQPANWLQDVLIPRLPKAFQDDKKPYVFLFAVLVIGVMLIFAVISPYHNGHVIPLIFAAAVLVLLVLVSRGMPMQTGIHLATLMGLLQLVYGAAMSGGIFSPRLAWLLILPLTPFFVISRKSGYAWLLVVLAVQAGMAALSFWGIGEVFELSVAYVTSSLTTYVAVTLLMIIVPLIYDTLYKKAIAASRSYQQTLEKTREELEHTLQMREHFIATVSHELRTPMNAILGFNALLQSKLKDQAEAQKIVEHTRQSADHLMTVISDVLDYSQLQSGRLSAHPEKFMLRDTIGYAFELFSVRVERTQLEYRCDIAPDVPTWVMTDRHRLMQILVNLLGNAIKFTHRGHVVLNVHADPQRGVVFMVEDTGIGIADAQKPHIFERFGQADDTIQTRYGGNGLGLAISQKLVELLGGDIGFDSTPGQGSSFWFNLPLFAVEPPETMPRQKQVLAVLSAQRPWRFLVVDDHRINRLLVRQVLQNAWPNSEVIEAENGAQALDLVRHKDFDAVLMDMVMPVMDGIAATRAIRELTHGRKPWLILGLTANVNPLDLETFRAAGLDAYMLKPFEPALLCAKLEALLQDLS